MDMLAVPEEDKLELTNLSRNCILHALEVLPKSASTTSLLSNLDKIKQFCQEISEITNTKSNAYKKRAAQRGASNKDTFVDSRVFDRFYNREFSSNDLLLQVEEKLNETLTEDFDQEALFRACWKVYSAARNPQPSPSQRFSDDSIYHLWLIFNAILPPESDTMLIPVKSLNVIMKRMLNLCVHEPIAYNYSGKKVALDYQEYLQAIANYTEPLKLQPSLIHEVVQDMKDEIIDGILKKGYLTKRGHKRKNWKRRWFILEKTVVKYFESKESQVQRGQMVLNTNTEVNILPDRGRRMYCFETVCGKTKTIYEIQCDDEKSRHDWMLAINKAIHLSMIFEGRATPDIGRSAQHAYLPNFHLIRFGSSQSIIPKWEGGVRIRQKSESKHHQSISTLRRPKIISMMESDNELSDEEDSRNQAQPIPITRRETESWVAINNPKYERSVSVQSSVPSPGGVFTMSVVEQDGKQRSTSDILTKHSISVDLSQCTPGEHTSVFEEFEEPREQEPEAEVKSSGPNSSPDLDQQGYSADISDPSAPRNAESHLDGQNSAVGHIKKKPLAAGTDDSPIIAPKHAHT